MSKQTIQSKVKTVEFYSTNLCKLIDLDLEWFERRLYLRQNKKFKEAERVEKEYLEPIQKKIALLATRAVKELSND